MTATFARGGAELQLAPLPTGLRGRGWPVEIASLVEPTSFAAADPERRRALDIGRTVASYSALFARLAGAKA
jgi:hypothetical protein